MVDHVGRPRARDLGIRIGDSEPGTDNAITDVPGVRVGHTTIDDGAALHTGVTAIVPRRLDSADETLPAACFVGNGYGKLVGSTQLDELGVLETPIVLTSTLSVFRTADAVLTHMMALGGGSPARTFNPVVGETNDGFLSDIRARPITERHVLDAIRGSSDGPVEQGCVGAGTGTAALGYKGGIGTSSRLLAAGGSAGTVGVLVQSNFGGTLTVRGVPLPASDVLRDETTLPAGTPPEPVPSPAAGNSCMIVVATDVALDARQLGRVARRAVFAMGRVGASFSGHSGDYAIAFCTADDQTLRTDDERLDAIFAATMDAVEEALLDSLFTARDTVGVHGHTARAVPADEVVRRLAAHGIR